ncbi:hypothetical protein CR163_004875 [Prosthecochloris sp. ZM_2]|nr:hypothetical protein CR163_004875 [Prosthecochloris sp. ZM_2]
MMDRNETPHGHLDSPFTPFRLFEHSGHRIEFIVLKNFSDSTLFAVYMDGKKLGDYQVPAVNDELGVFCDNVGRKLVRDLLL